MNNQSRNVGRCLCTGAAVALAATATTAIAQLTPERTYYGADRPIPVAVNVPGEAEGAQITLYHPDGAEAASADVAPGRVDLAALFPQLWGGEHQHIHYAQLVVGGEGVGAPVVLQPLLTPQYAYAVNRSGEAVIPRLADPRAIQPMFEQEIVEAVAAQQGMPAPTPQVVYSGIRAWPDKHVVFETSEGDIEFRLRPDEAPNTNWNFLTLAEGGFYTDIIFHRIVAEAGNGHPFVIQVGDPTGTGAGGPGYFVDLEPTDLPHDFGVLSMARSTEPNSNGSQVFVCLSRPGTAFLDGNYTAFAEAVGGGDVIRAIASAPVGPGDRPTDPPVLKSARLIDAPPFGTAPEPLSKSASPDAGADADEQSDGAGGGG